MKVKFLGVTQETYRATSDKPPVRLIQVSRGAVIDLPEVRVKKLQKDYPQDWEVFEEHLPARVSEPVAAEPKGEESSWTRKKVVRR